MTADKNFIEKLHKKHHLEIDEKLEAYLLLAEYEEEPFPYEWSEQDLYEQIRKLTRDYREGKLDITLKSPIERLRERYEALQEEYMYLAFDAQALLDILEENGINSPFEECADADNEELPF